jgi:uncharacterized protein (DUF427 family)
VSGRNARLSSGVSETVTRALFDGVVVADSDDVRFVEGLAYFPRDSVNDRALLESRSKSLCFWKGKARYWHVMGDDDVATDAAFAYERPWPLARRLVTDRIAFWQGVQIVE